MPLFSTKQFSSRIITIYSQLHQPFSKTINLKTNHKLKLLHIRPIYHFKLRICWYVCRLIECTLLSEKYISVYSFPWYYSSYVIPCYFTRIISKLTTINYSTSTKLTKHLGNQPLCIPFEYYINTTLGHTFLALFLSSVVASFEGVCQWL